MHLHVFFLKSKLIGFQYVHDVAYYRLNRTIYILHILYILNIMHIIAYL
jgi:hypothetical protein